MEIPGVLDALGAFPQKMVLWAWPQITQLVGTDDQSVVYWLGCLPCMQARALVMTVFGRQEPFLAAATSSLCRMATSAIVAAG